MKKAIDVVAESENVQVVKARPMYATDEIAETVWDKGDTCGTVPQVPELTELQGFLKVEIAAFRDLEGKASIRALKIGVLIVRARKDIKYGEYGNWIRANVPFERKTVWRFTSMAEIFLGRNKLSIDEAYEAFVQHKNLVEGKSASKPVQLAFDFVGKSTFRELCDKIGHPVAKRGGDHGGGAAYHALANRPQEEKDAEMRKLTEDDWQVLVREIGKFVRMGHRQVHLSKATLKCGYESLSDCVKDLRRELANRDL